ncbi:MAG: endonuclease domain-containing protein [Caulobacterales bacterium]
MGVSERTPGAIHTNERAERAARRMRNDPTFTERQLWKALRSLDGFHFRRQAPMGPYVVDFVCHRSRLVIEADGGIHNVDVVAARDAARDAWLAGRGYRVVRLSNAQALTAAESGDAFLLAAIGVSTPTPDPSPQGGGESSTPDRRRRRT